MSSSELWNDVYFRTNKDDVGKCPTDGCLSSCFDIITKRDPLSDPAVLIDGDWDKNASEDLTAGMNNYIYVRGQNPTDAQKDVAVHLYYSRANLLLYPSEWQEQEIPCGTSKNGVKLSVGPKEKFICLGDDKTVFWWKPEMITKDHYCLISRACTAEHPADIPLASDIDTFAKFISTNRSYGWRNVSVVDGDRADKEVEINYTQGTKGHDMHILLSCIDAPIGAEVAFDCPTLPGMHMTRTKITSHDQDLGVVCYVPDNFTGKITYYYWANGQRGGDNFKLTLHAVYFVPTSSELYQYAKHYEELGFKFAHKDREMLRLGNSIGPERGIILGQYSTEIARK